MASPCWSWVTPGPRRWSSRSSTSTASGTHCPQIWGQWTLPGCSSLGITHTVCENTGQRGRPATAFYLNRRQALFIITQAGTNTALEITTEVVRKFDAYENGLIQFEPTLEEWRDPRMAAPSKRGVRSGTSPSPAICPPKPPPRKPAERPSLPSWCHRSPEGEGPSEARKTPGMRWSRCCGCTGGEGYHIYYPSLLEKIPPSDHCPP